jgi:ABC-type multidrug transport system fused ATPase/permease subunit
MTSVERISEYTALPPETGYSVDYSDYKNDPDLRSMHENTTRSRSMSQVKTSLMKYQPLPKDVAESEVDAGNSRPRLGLLELQNLTVTYHTEMEPVLKNISVRIPAGAKVGICGRTGSGKSSTLLALLRLNIVTKGDILLDGDSLLRMSLEDARAQLSTIPQDPHLFSGTIRFNVDPFGVYTDEEIWSALESACIKPYIMTDAAGLNMMVDEGGKNFSVGQRQLISMSRAILRHCPVVLMDEVTASIDYDTDRAIQRTIRTSPALCSSTIITVAHRLRTIADSDLIMVVQKGDLVEFGRPVDLLASAGSIYKTLAVESNELEEICRLAEESAQRSGLKL